MAYVETSLSEEPLDVAEAIGTVSGPECGGVALFLGSVRTSPSTRPTGEGEVVRLEYDAHPTLAGERMQAIAHEAAAKWEVRRVVAVHRTGGCDVGEPTVVVACGAPHRHDALEACRWIIDSIKASVPIWKREVFADGASWVGADHGA